MTGPVPASLHFPNSAPPSPAGACAARAALPVPPAPPPGLPLSPAGDCAWIVVDDGDAALWRRRAAILARLSGLCGQLAPAMACLALSAIAFALVAASPLLSILGD